MKKQWMKSNQMRNVILATCIAVIAIVFPFVSQADATTPEAQSGTLVISAQWIHQPMHFMACVHYHNPFNNLGALMGGHTKSRGECYDPNVNQLMVEVANADGHTIVKNYRGISLAPGIYSITVWPYDFRELAQSIKQLEISANTTVKKELEFDWPYIEKTAKRQGYKPFIVLKRRHPIGKGTLHLAVTINGDEKAVVAEVNANKLGYNGQESTSFYQYHSFKHGGNPGFPLPVSLSLPEGSYHVHVRPYGLANKVIALEIHTGQTISRSLDFTKVEKAQKIDEGVKNEM